MVAYCAIAANEDIICDCLPEYLNFENVGNDLFGLAINVWMDEGNVVVACDHIPEC